MIPYLALAAMPAVLSLFFPNRLNYADLSVKRQAERKYLFLCGLILFLFLALRSRGIGSTDTTNYYNMMRRAIAADSWQEYYNPERVEIGFQFFTFVLSRVFHSAQTIIVVSAAIYTVSIAYSVYCNSQDVVFSMIMYVTLGLMQFEMQGMRQSIAMSICLFAYEAAKKRKIIPFMLLILLAMQFHQTAVVFAVIYIIFWLKYKWNYIFAFIAISGVFFYSSNYIIGFANELFDRHYYTSVDSGGFIASAIYFLIIAFALVFNRKLYTDRIQTASLYLTMTGCMCFLMRYVGTLAAERISFYFMFGQLILLPNTINCMKGKDRQLTKFIAVMLMFALFAYRLRGSDFLPYYFFWQ